MPSDVVAIVVSTGIGVSVIAGVLSGVCYVLAHGITKKRSREPALQWYCVVCGYYLRSRTPENIKAVLCVECEERVCKQRCSKRDSARKGWMCYTCLKRPSWLQSIVSSISFPFKKVNSPENIILEQSEQMGKKLKNSRLSQKQKKECVRDFIEKIVSAIVGGNVDDASVLRMYNDNEYRALFDRYHRDLSEAITNLSSALQIAVIDTPFPEQNPSSAHTSLKLLIEKILGEVAHFPKLHEAVKSPTRSSEKERTYEELLATAILNKIISKQDNYWPSSSAASIDSDKGNKDYLFGGETWESEWTHGELESTSNSSLDEYLQSDSSLGSTKYVDRISLTIQQRIDEVPSAKLHEDVNSTLQDIHYTTSSTFINDQSNWYLQKRRFPDTNSPVPVPMLVPNPLTSAKVLIGDKEADETSDLSDTTSEYDGLNLASEIQNLEIDSTLTIDQKALNNFFSDEETSFDSGVREDRDDFSEREKFYYSEPKTCANLEDESIEDISLHDVEKNLEYSEKYSSLPKTLFRTPSTVSSVSPLLIQQRSGENTFDFQKQNQEPINDNRNNTPTFEGSYSRKEKEKWSHPINMPCNPYSEENIRKRIHSNQIFGRDYYTKQASLPSGTAKFDEENILWQEESSLYRAIPARTTDNESEFQDKRNYTETTDVWNQDEQNISDITSNSDLSLVNYYNVENSKIYCHPPKDNKKKLEIKVNKKEACSISSDDLPQLMPVEADETDAIAGVHINSDIGKTSPGDSNEDVTDKTNDENAEPLQDDSPTVLLTNVSHTQEILTTTRKPVVNQTFNDILIKENQTEHGQVPPSVVFVAKKSDNTLIKKIYSNPIVRNFALINREQIPYETDDQNSKSKNNVIRNEPNNTVSRPKDKDDITNDPFNVYSNNSESKHDHYAKVSLPQNFSLEFSDNESLKEENSKHRDDDFSELRERRLVANRLGEFSKSFPNLTKKKIFDYDHNKNNVIEKDSEEKLIEKPVDAISPSENFVSVDSEEKLIEKPVDAISPFENFVSVKDLKKLFEKNDTIHYSKDKPVHSLTARSISKEMKQKLRTYSTSEYANDPQRGGDVKS